MRWKEKDRGREKRNSLEKDKKVEKDKNRYGERNITTQCLEMPSEAMSLNTLLWGNFIT